MRRIALLSCVVALWGCKDPETQEKEERQRATQAEVNKGREALAASDFEGAVRHFGRATGLAPTDPMAFVLLAQSQRQAGLDGAAVLSLKQAEDLGARSDPAVKRERAELYRHMGQTAAAIATLVEMRDANMLTDLEILMLSRMQARAGDLTAALRTLEIVQKKRPDDPEAKAVEAEILLDKGEDVYAAKLMDRLLIDYPTQSQARLLRARYFLTNGYPEMADQDLSAIGPEAQKTSEVVAMRARVLTSLKRYDDAAKLLQPLVDDNPREADFSALLAETRLNLGQHDEAQALVDQALAVRAEYPRALYVRGRSLEEDDNLKGALDNYKAALKSDPRFAPALSRMWGIYLKQGDRPEAISALERLLLMGEANPDEKLALATLYADTGLNTEKGRKLIEGLFQRDGKYANDPKVMALWKKLGGGKPQGVIIMRNWVKH